MFPQDLFNVINLHSTGREKGAKIMGILNVIIS